MGGIVEVIVERVTVADAERICEAMLHDGLSRVLASLLSLNHPLRMSLGSLATAMLAAREGSDLSLACDLPQDIHVNWNRCAHLHEAVVETRPRMSVMVSGVLLVGSHHRG